MIKITGGQPTCWPQTRRCVLPGSPAQGPSNSPHSSRSALISQFTRPGSLRTNPAISSVHMLHFRSVPKRVMLAARLLSQSVKCSINTVHQSRLCIDMLKYRCGTESQSAYLTSLHRTCARSRGMTPPCFLGQKWHRAGLPSIGMVNTCMECYAEQVRRELSSERKKRIIAVCHCARRVSHVRLRQIHLFGLCLCGCCCNTTECNRSGLPRPTSSILHSHAT